MLTPFYVEQTRNLKHLQLDEDILNKIILWDDVCRHFPRTYPPPTSLLSVLSMSFHFPVGHQVLRNNQLTHVLYSFPRGRELLTRRNCVSERCPDDYKLTVLTSLGIMYVIEEIRSRIRILIPGK